MELILSGLYGMTIQIESYHELNYEKSKEVGANNEKDQHRCSSSSLKTCSPAGSKRFLQKPFKETSKREDSQHPPSLPLCLQAKLAAPSSPRRIASRRQL
jgi:hypothetical protein